MANKQTVGKFKKRVTTKHPGIIAKTKQSSNKGADKYKKPYVGQGR